MAVDNDIAELLGRAAGCDRVADFSHDAGDIVASRWLAAKYREKAAWLIGRKCTTASENDQA